MKDFKSDTTPDRWANCGQKLASFLIGVVCSSLRVYAHAWDHTPLLALMHIQCGLSLISQF